MNTSALSAALSRRPGRSGGLPRLTDAVTDAVIAAAVAAVQLAGWYATSSGPGHHGRAADPLSYLLLAVGAVSLLARRRYPTAVLAVALVTTLSAGPLGARTAWLVLITAFVSAVLFRRRLAAIASLVIGYVVSVWPPWLIGSPGHTPAVAALGLLAGLITLLSAAELSRARGQRAAAVRRGRAEEARRRASEERLAIARDLHDVVAHNISVINVQANTALHLMDRQPERARAALTAIHEVSRQALGELRSVLGVLRADDDGAPLAPTPGLDRAAGFLVKDTDAAELIRAVRVAAAGESLLSPTVTRRLIAEFAARTKDARPVRGMGELTAREREVVGLIATGLSNEEIARQIYVSLSTVKTHATRAMTKLGARDRAQLVVFAYQAGLVRPGWA